MVGQKGKMFKFLKKLWCWFGTVLLKKGKGFELREEPPQGLQAKELTATVSLFTMHLHTTRFTIPRNTTAL